MIGCMPSPFNSPDLFIRVMVIAITSLIIALITRDSTYDLHFKLRKAQRVSSQVQVIETADNFEAELLIKELRQRNVKWILSNHFIWDQRDNLTTPYSVNDKALGFLNFSLTPDLDGIIRKVNIEAQNDNSFFKKFENRQLTLNFRGPAETFLPLPYFDFQETDPNLEDKIVILKFPDPLQSFTTPVGLLNETEFVANIVDNTLENRFIPSPNFGLHLFLLLIILIVNTLILLFLPSTLALVGTLIFTIIYVSLSLWIFDTFYIWTPILTPLIQIVVTLLLISNYKYILNERTRWGLEKDTLLFEEVEEMKTNFLSLFSHDLKTPLAKIIGLTDLILEKTQDPDVRDNLDKINLASRELEKYIKRILKMSQVQSKNISIQRKPEDINNLIEKSILQNQFLAKQKKIALVKNTQPLFMIEIDGSLIQEVINNFLENAITYSPEGSQIIISSQENQNFIKVSVTDQGQGIPKHAQDTIWEKYYRFDSQKSGYGLGLFLSRYVIQLHGGKVYLKSKEYSGSEFGFILPIDESPRSSHEAT